MKLRTAAPAWTWVWALALCASCQGAADTENPSQGSDATTAGDACIPGQSMPCTCDSGDPGARVCLDDGEEYGACSCEEGGQEGTTATSGGSGDDGGTQGGEVTDTGPTSETDSGTATEGFDGVEDDFERSELGQDWAVIFPPAPNDQVQIIGASDLGMTPGPQGFFLVNWRGSVFAPDQYCEATTPLDVTDGWAHQVYVRWREVDGARYGFGYNNDPGQPQFGNWYFKYDGVPTDSTRVFATAPADAPPQPGDVLRVEIEGYSLRGFHNGALVLEATDEDPSKIDDGEVGLAARWATGNQAAGVDAKVWESWAGGSL